MRAQAPTRKRQIVQDRAGLWPRRGVGDAADLEQGGPLRIGVADAEALHLQAAKRGGLDQVCSRAGESPPVVRPLEACSHGLEGAVPAAGHLTAAEFPAPKAGDLHGRSPRIRVGHVRNLDGAVDPLDRSLAVARHGVETAERGEVQIGGADLPVGAGAAARARHRADGCAGRGQLADASRADVPSHDVAVGDDLAVVARPHILGRQDGNRQAPGIEARKPRVPRDGRVGSEYGGEIVLGEAGPARRELRRLEQGPAEGQHHVRDGHVLHGGRALLRGQSGRRIDEAEQGRRADRRQGRPEAGAGLRVEHRD